MAVPVRISDLVEYLQGFGVSDALIPLLIMTASFESGLSNDVIGVNKNGTKDYGVYQINVDSFYTDRDENKPDDTIKTFFKKTGKKYKKSELENKLNNNEKFASQFVAHYIKRLSDNPKSFGTDGDPLNKWNAYKDHVVPLTKGEKIDRDLESVTNAIGAYVDSYMQLEAQQFKKLFKVNTNVVDSVSGNNGRR
tara:strand:+ start:44 stop:625 length:582 start_codon:yes stop_codon:yes gene_type:complete